MKSLYFFVCLLFYLCIYLLMSFFTSLVCKYVLQSSFVLLFVPFVFAYVICVFLYTIVFWIMRIKIYI